MGVERVFWGGTLDQHGPLLVQVQGGLDVSLLTSNQGRGTVEKVHVVDPLGEGGVLDGEADVEVVDQDGGSQDEVAAFLECSAEEGGCAAGIHGHSKVPLRVRVGE